MSRHSPRARAALLAAAVLALLAGCKEPPGSSLFPLEEGRRWTYRLSSEWENDTRERETVVLSNLGRDSALESGSAWHRRSDTGLDYWLRAASEARPVTGLDRWTPVKSVRMGFMGWLLDLLYRASV